MVVKLVAGVAGRLLFVCMFDRCFVDSMQMCYVCGHHNTSMVWL